jgi:photosynthetic reaction center cytochrome c subunit
MSAKCNIGPLLTLAIAALLSACERPPIESAQTGYRGTGMATVENPRLAVADEGYPAALPAAPASGPKASEVYQNVPLLGDLSVAQFTRLMTGITAWVSPEEGCGYCHDLQNLASDELYTKIVSRRMIEMTRDINADWSSHVGSAGVNCYTCHRGNPVPEYIWFSDANVQSRMATYAGNRRGQNQPSPAVGLSSLPVDSFSTYLSAGDAPRARIIPTAIYAEDGATIQDTEAVYGLMMHISESLGVNCTYCHNSASFQNWDNSNPARRSAWFGIEMVRVLNAEYFGPLQGNYPEHRLGPSGDAPKAYCLTCHQGQPKPLGGGDAVSAYPALAAHR